MDAGWVSTPQEYIHKMQVTVSAKLTLYLLPDHAQQWSYQVQHIVYKSFYLKLMCGDFKHIANSETLPIKRQSISPPPF